MKIYKYILSIAILMIFSAVTGCTVNPVTGKEQLRLISSSQEIAIGKQAAPGFEKEFDGKVQNPQLQSYINEIGLKVSAHADRKMPYEFTMLNSDTPNAFALPGGKIYITAGLFKQMTSERQLAAVLSHETVHIAAMHNIDSLQRQMGTQILLDIAQKTILKDSRYADLSQKTLTIVSNMVNLRHSQEQEYEADKFGIKYMVKAGYNPLGMTELLQTLKNGDKSNPGRFTAMFRTHPLTTNRIEQARQTIQQRYSKYATDQPLPDNNRFLQMKKLLINTQGN